MAWRIERPPTAFTNDRDRKSRGGRRQEKDHLSYLRKLPCCVCGSRMRVEAAHIRYRSPLYGKGGTAMGTKPDDRWAVPLDDKCHRTGPEAQHGTNEERWWADRGIDPLALAATLFSCSGDVEMGEQVIQATRLKAKKGVPV